MVMAADPAALVGAARQGDRGAIAKLISLVETGGHAAFAAVADLYRHTGDAYTVGMTGAPGSGKSTLTDKVIARIRGEGVEVGVLAIDPTSPFTGGAILGDRVRMQDHALDAGVFIRSMATRGHLGGLALAAPEAIRVLDATGFDWVLLETVGVGQVEVEVAAEADTTLVVVNPGWGDAVQTSKAGLLEVADVFVVNKADRPGVDEARRDLQHMLDLAGDGTGSRQRWRPPIVAAVASDGTGVADVMAAVRDHRAHLESGGELARRRDARLRDEVQQVVAELVRQRVKRVVDDAVLADTYARLQARAIDPYRAADELLAASGFDRAPADG